MTASLLYVIERQANMISELANKKLKNGTDREKARARLECHSKLRELLEDIEEEI